MLFPRQPPAPPPRHQFNQAEAMECEQNNMNEVREQELEETNTEIAHCQSEDRTHYTAEENEVTNTKSGNATSAFTSLSIPSPSSLSSNVSYNSLNVNDRFTSWSNNPSSEMIMKILQPTREPAPPPPQLSLQETVETNHTTTSITATTMPETEEPKSESIFSKFNFKNIGLALFSSSPEEDEEEQEAHKKEKLEEELQESKRRENKLGDQAKNKKENNSKTWNSSKMSKFKDVRQRPSVQVMQRPTRKGSRVEATITTTPSSSSSLAKGVNSRINTHRNKPTNNNNSTSSSMADKNKIGATEKFTTQSKNKTPLAKKTCTGVSATTNLEHDKEDKEVTAVLELQSKTHKLKLDNAKSNKRIGHRRNSSSLSSNSDSSLSLSSSSSTSLSSLTSNSNSSSSSSTSSLGLSTTSLTGDKEHALQNVKKTKELTKSEKRVSFGDTSSQTHPKNAHHRHSHHSKQHHHHHNRKNNNNKNSNDKKLNQSSENISLSSSTSSLSSTSSSSISSLSSSSLLPEHPSSSSSTAHSHTKSGKHKHKHKNRHKHQHHQSSNSTGGGTEVGSRRRSLGASAKSDGNGHDNEKATSSSSFAANATQNINAAPSAPPVLSFRDRVHKGVAPPSRKRVIRKRNASEPRPPTNITGPVDTFRVGQGTRRSALARRNNNLNSNNNKEELKNVSTLSLLPERLRRRYFHVLLHVAQFWHNMMKVVLIKRQRTAMESSIAPHAAFVIQCAWRRLQQRRRLGEYNAWGFLCPWIRLQHQRRKRALEHSARVIQNISRSAQARSWIHFLYMHKHRLAGLHVIARKVHVWEDEKLLRHMRYQRDERNLLITNWQQESNSLLREERASWLHIVNKFYNLKRVGMKSHCDSNTTFTTKQENVCTTTTHYMNINAMKVLPPFYEASALWCADSNLDLISRILSVESGEYLLCSKEISQQANNAISPNNTNRRNARELHETESMDFSINANAIYEAKGKSSGSDVGSRNDQNTESEKITGESVRSAFLELLIQSESVERKQLSHKLLQEHDAFCTPVVLASRSIRFAQTAEVPLLFAPLLLSFHSDYFLRRAVKLFCLEELDRNAIVGEYDALPLCNLHRPVLLARAEERRLHLIHNYAPVEVEYLQNTHNQEVKNLESEQFHTRDECEMEVVQNKVEEWTENESENAMNAEIVKEKETKTLTRLGQPNILSATFPYIISSSSNNNNNNSVIRSTCNDVYSGVRRSEQRSRPPTPPPRRRWAELTLPPLAHKNMCLQNVEPQKKCDVLQKQNNFDVINKHGGAIGAYATVHGEVNHIQNNRIKKGKKGSDDTTAKAAAAADVSSSSFLVNVIANNSDAAVNMLMSNMLFTAQPSNSFSFASGELKKSADEKASGVIQSSFCFGDSSITSENSRERHKNINNDDNKVITNTSKTRDNVLFTSNSDALRVMRNSNSVSFAASVEKYRNM